MTQAEEAMELMACSRCGRYAGPEDLCNACEQADDQAWNAASDRRQAAKLALLAEVEWPE